MKILNRGFISIKPTNLYIDWKLNQSQEELIEPENPEATIYLIEEEFWDDEIILNKYFKKIAQQEFNSIETLENCLPTIETLEDFTKFFHAELGTFVFDLLKTPISLENIDL
jgi:hypothetical protein